MSEIEEMDLLVDLAKLVRKHGPQAFGSLADRLSQPDFVRDLVVVLQGLATSSRKVQIQKRTPRATFPRGDHERFYGPHVVDPLKMDLLGRLDKGMKEGALLPTLRDIRDVSAASGLPPIKAKTRDRAINSLLRVLAELPMAELELVAERIESARGFSDRSLEGWSRIILGGKESKEDKS